MPGVTARNCPTLQSILNFELTGLGRRPRVIDSFHDVAQITCATDEGEEPVRPANGSGQPLGAGDGTLVASPPVRKTGARGIPDWVPHAILLSSFLSLLAHGVMLVIFAVTLRSCSPAPVGFGTEESREVGIVMKERGDSPDARIPGEPRDGAATDSTVDSAAMHDSSAPTTATPELPPVETLLPQDEPSSRIGPGVNLPNGASVSDPRQPVKSGGGQRPATMGTVGGVPGAAFMGAEDQGSKVIFVIDASGSMTSKNSMQVAKAALVSSLQALDAHQQFLIIFYDDKPTVLHLRDVHKPQLYAATEIHKTLAKQKIAGIQPGTGTQHVPALEMALKLHPDVIFFLTDAQEPPIYEGELVSLKNLNNKKTRIHSIEFGVGPEVSDAASPKNFLRRLSRQNGGTYRYYDVTKFK